MNSNISSKPLNLGLIGAGQRTRHILRGLLGCAPEGQLRVLSAYDPAPESRDELQKLLGYEVEHAGSDQAVARHPGVDWVFIGSPNCYHARQAVAALNAGKNVFCEKPLATTLEDCLAIRDAASASKRVFAFGLVLRYSPHYAKIREIVDSGMLGKIISMEFNETLGFNHGGYIFADWRRFQTQAGSHMLEKCCHDLDLANWLVGSVPVRVASFGGRDFYVPSNVGRIAEIGPDDRGRPAYLGWFPETPYINPFESKAEICDNQVAILEYANGARATFHTNCNAAIPERRMYVLGSHGALRADLCTGQIEIKRIGWKPEIEKVAIDARGGHGGGDEVMGAALVRTMMEGEPPLASVREGICSAIAAFGIDQAIAEGGVADLRPLWAKAGIDPATIMARAS